MQKDLVSIITPCYNTGAIVHRLLDSILIQNYPSVEMYCIDDGSTDNTREVIESYIPKFSEKGYSLKYIHQQNGGQSSAVNNALKLIKGEFLTWPDSDDYYRESTAISSFVNTLKQLDDSFAIVRSLPTFVSETDCHDVSRLSISDAMTKEWQFNNCLDSKAFIWPPVNYMIKTSALDTVNPSREIYVEKNAGQNWQMLLPILYTYKCYTLTDYLCNVMERESSHSRGQYQTFEQQISKFSSYRNTILSTLDNIVAMPAAEKDTHKKYIITKYKVQELQLAIQFHNKKAIAYVNKELKELGVEVDKTKRLRWWVNNYPLGKLLIRIINKIF